MKKRKVGLFFVVSLLLAVILMTGCVRASSQNPLPCPEWTGIEGDCDVVIDTEGFAIPESRTTKSMSATGVQAIRLNLPSGKLVAYESFGIKIETEAGETFEFEDSILKPGVYYIYLVEERGRLRLEYEKIEGFSITAHLELYSSVSE